jgi:sugar phosphate isomerase/epimerase
MSATPSPNVELTKEHCRPADVTPVTVDAEALESTAPEYLRDLKHELTEEGLYPAGLELTASFDEDCSLSTQETVDRVRDHVRAAAFLGAGRVTVTVDRVANEAKVQPALDACRERARRDGVALEIDGPVTLDA